MFDFVIYILTSYVPAIIFWPAAAIFNPVNFSIDLSQKNNWFHLNNHRNNGNYF